MSLTSILHILRRELDEFKYNETVDILNLIRETDGEEEALGQALTIIDNLNSNSDSNSNSNSNSDLNPNSESNTNEREDEYSEDEEEYSDEDEDDYQNNNHIDVEHLIEQVLPIFAGSGTPNASIISLINNALTINNIRLSGNRVMIGRISGNGGNGVMIDGGGIGGIGGLNLNDDVRKTMVNDQKLESVSGLIFEKATSSDICNICTENIEKDKVKPKCCNVYFCPECLEQWLKEAGCRCPTCHNDIEGAETVFN